MPNYYNSYPMANYQNYGTPAYSQMQPSYSQPNISQAMQPPQGNPMMSWADGEAAARSFQVPANHPLGQPYPIWDSNDTVIYLKTLDQFGRPMPLRKLRYQFEDDNQVQGNLMSGATSGHNEDMSQYVTKQDFDSMKNDLMAEIRKMNSGNNPRYQVQNNKEQGGKQ